MRLIKAIIGWGTMSVVLLSIALIVLWKGLIDFVSTGVDAFDVIFNQK